MIVVVSDTHLGYKESDAKAFKDFISNYISKELGPTDHFILLGDIFDFWRRTNIETLLENKDILTKILNLDTKVHYVIGNHDYYMLKIKNKFPDYYTFDLQKYLRLKDGKKDFFLIHGYELDVFANYEFLTVEEYERISDVLCHAENLIGRIMSIVWGLKKKLKKPPNERKSWTRRNKIVPHKISHMNNLEKLTCSIVKNILLGLKHDEKLVFGHTHRPFIYGDTGNTGSWVKEELHYNTFIKIENGEMELKKWNKKVINLDKDPYITIK